MIHNEIYTVDKYVKYLLNYVYKKEFSKNSTIYTQFYQHVGYRGLNKTETLLFKRFRGYY